MAYAKHIWECNEPISVEQLNRMEEGIDGVTPLVVRFTVSGETYKATADKTYAEIAEAKRNGKMVTWVCDYEVTDPATSLKIAFSGGGIIPEAGVADGKYTVGVGVDAFAMSAYEAGTNRSPQYQYAHSDDGNAYLEIYPFPGG